MSFGISSQRDAFMLSIISVKIVVHFQEPNTDHASERTAPSLVTTLNMLFLKSSSIIPSSHFIGSKSSYSYWDPREHFKFLLVGCCSNTRIHLPWFFFFSKAISLGSQKVCLNEFELFSSPFCWFFFRIAHFWYQTL